MPTSTEVRQVAGLRARYSRISTAKTGTPSQSRHRFALSIPIHQFTRLNWGILLFMLLGVSLAAQAQVSGTVFRDFNANGVRDGASEVGVGGVSVTAFNAAGAQVATTTSTTAGAYSFSGLSFPVRIQFGNLGGSDFTGPSGSDSKSSVQFYSAATTTANFGVNNPSDYCQAAPSLFTTCFTNGSRSLSNPSENDVLVAIPNGATLSGTVQHLATAPNMGSVWGVAYDRVNKIVYTSAFLKRHSDFGPQGISGLYWGSYTGSALSSQGSIALNTISGNIFGTNPRSDGVAPDDNLTGVSYNQPSYDRDVYQNVAKLGIGDIDLSPDGKTLYVMNLTQRRLAAFDVSAVASGGNPTYLGSYAITDPGCSGGQFRPFGIKVVNKNLIYVGVTCSGETSQNRADLMAYICQIVPSAGFAATSTIVPIATIQPPTNSSFDPFVPPVPPTNAIPMYYNKVWASEYGNAFEAQNYIFEPWKTAWPTTQSIFAAPQPLLSDIEINRNGDLVLGIMDRMGHMAGYQNYDISGTSNALYSDFAYGDILYVCNKGTSGSPVYYLEGHPNCPSPATNPNFQGPGGREYFNDETPSHREGAQGGLVLLPQENYTVTGMMDPGMVTYSSGLTVFNNSSGQSVQALTLAGAAFGKAGGIGDMEVNCNPAPIEIGNRVWKDIDNDGIQDAGEPPLAGVTLSLFASCTGTAIATAVTDANGNYYFSSAAGTSTASNRYGLNLLYGASYCVRVTSLGSDTSVSGLSLTSLSPAPGEVSGSPNSSTTVTNNDAFLESGQPTIRLVTGSAGENNHTYDIGFPGSCSMVATVTAGLCAPATNTYSATAVVQLTNPTAGVLTVSTGAQSQTFTTTAVSSATFTAVFTGLISDGVSHTVTASLPDCSTTTATYTAPVSCSVAPCGVNLTVTPGLCLSATNSYVLSGTITTTNVPVSGTLTITSAAFTPRSLTLPAGNATGTFSYSGLVSNGQTYTVTASYSNSACAPVSQTYTAPVSCSVAPVCSLSAAVTAGLCASATNTYSATAVVTVQNPVAGVLTVTNGAQSATLTTSNATGPVSYTAVFAGLVSDGASHTVTASLPGCSTATTTYTAPTSCSVAPVCSLTATVTAGLCASATNTYSATAVVQLTNPTAGVLTVTNGAQSLTFATTAVSSATYTATFTGLVSDGASHTVVASLPGCSTTTATYTAPTSCSVAPVCSLSAAVTAGLCASATNTYSATAVVQLTNPVAGVLTVTNGAQSLTFATTAAPSAVYTVEFPGLVSDGVSHTVTASLPGCGTTTATYTAPASCSVAPVCSLTAAVTAGVCASATNTYSATAVVQLTNPTVGVLTVTNGAQSLTFATTSTSSATYTAVFNGLISDGASHTVVASLPGCSTTTATYTAPASCSVAPVCSLSATVTAGVCASATNTYSATALVTIQNPVGGVLTVSNGPSSITATIPAGSGQVVFPAIFNGLISDGASHTVVASLPGCSTTTATYTAPASCTVAPVCSLTAAVTAGLCASATNTYSATAVVQLTNPTAGVLTVSNGAQSFTFATTATSSATYTAVFTGLTSDGASHTVVASLPGCSTTTATYTAPASCTVAPVCSLTAAVTAGLCASATNTYSATAVVQLTNPTAGVLTVINGAQSFTFATTATSSATYTAVFTGLTSDGASHTVVASLPGCSTTTATYTAPVSCTVAPVCSLTAAVTAGLCASATNTYSATAVVQLTNPTAGVLTVINGTQSFTFATTAVSSATYTAVFTGLTSDGASHTVVASLPGCSTTTTTYTSPASCTVAPVCSLTAAVTAGLCASATNTYSATAVVQLTNPTAGVLTVTNGTQSFTFATTSTSSATYTAVFTGLTSDGASHTVVASLPGCSTTTATYTAPASCTVAPVCSLTAAVTAGLCASATNTYSATAVVQLTNPTAGVLTVINGAQSFTFATTATSSATYTAVFTGLTSDGASHTVVASLPGCGTTTTTYTAPVSCTVAPVCSLTAAVTAGICASATNTYSATAVVQLTNPTAGVLTVINGAQSFTFATTATSSATYTAVFTGLTSDGASHTVVASLPGCSTTTATYTAPVSCTVAPVCSLTAAVTAGLCASATNTYSATAVVQLTNPTAGVLTVINGAQSFTFATTATSSATYTAVFTGLTSDGASHTVVASLPGCSTTTAQYSAPGSCTATALELVKLVDKSKAQLGEVISYTVVLTNTGNAAATNVVVRDSMSLGLTYVANSATAPAGTTFTAGSPVSTWSIASIGAGQSLSLILQGIADSTGILHNTAMIGGDTATVCTSIPVRVCVGDEFEYLLTAPAGQSSYQWYLDGQPIVGATSNSLSVTAVGSYSLRVDSQSGQCPDFSCCPFIIEADSLPVYQAATLAASCIGNAAQSNGQLVLSGFQTGYTYQYSLGSSFTTSVSGPAQAIPANGVIANTLANPVVAQAYTIRVYNAAGCYRDVTVLLLPTVCGCPAEICVPFVLQQTKRGKRIGDPVQK